MRVSLAWLAEWIPLPALEPLCERLTLGGLEIESVEKLGPDLSDVRVGQVLARAAHPDADRLSVCQVDVGAEAPLAIVCGAPNVAAGQRVAVALHGVELPGGLKIKRSKIRGVVSNGMICSRRELGLGDEHEGILVLPPDAPLGASLTEVLDAGDTVLDLEITPNRGDWASMLGIAREVRAHFGGELRLPPTEPPETGAPASEAIAVQVEDAAGCSRYVARVVRGVRVGASPEWLVARLEAAGLRAINAVVDVTNLVMLEFGQPLHAFDLRKLAGGRVAVRSARAGEKLETLDGQLRELVADDLVIADARGAVAVAGVMGGRESEVDETTRDVLIESAAFDPTRIRRTARRLGLRSDASYRFERGVDPDGQARAADRAARLLAELTGGEVARGAVEALGAPVARTAEIELDAARVNGMLGTALEVGEIVALLARVDVAAEARDGGRLRCRPPRHRGDLALAADLVEEIARIHGYDRIPATLPAASGVPRELPPGRETLEGVRTGLAAAGLTELMSFPGAREDDDEALRLAPDDPRRRHVRIRNPIQAHEPQLRTTLVPSLLRAVALNRSRQRDRIAVYEIGRVFRSRGREELPEEPREAALAICETAAPSLWGPREVPVYFRAKGALEHLLAGLHLAAEFVAGDVEPFLHPGAAGAFRVAGRRVAVVGELHPETAAAFGLDASLALAVVDVEAIDALPRAPTRYAEVSRQPRVVRDLAVLLSREVAAGDVLAAIRSRAGASLADAHIFDRFEGKGVPEGQVSVAFRLVFQRQDRTLTEAEVAQATERVVQLLAKQFGAALR